MRGNILGKSQRVKGRNGELELVKILQSYGYPVEAGMSVNYGRTPDITGLNGIHVEVKRNEHLNLQTAMKQAENDSLKFHDGYPTVFHRKNNENWEVTMSLADWIKLYSVWELYISPKE